MQDKFVFIFFLIPKHRILSDSPGFPFAARAPPAVGKST